MRMRYLMLTALSVALAMPALGEEYTLLSYETEADLAARAEGAAPSHWQAYSEMLDTLGLLRRSTELDPRASWRIGGVEAADGAPLYLAGYVVIATEDPAVAESLAATMPAALRGGAVEVRRTSAR
ncbi:hypothetical protein [Pontivivens ytuae]|uniref:YCII-related domain-containing protein n=1 Tax=Pontivivens ytuae TaxID=2789856 RepID=A0A7S9QB66_9RHOB|nr:hypothetical protein [Pontivivens ytuae]QPH52355.1 hypothetical protein I0K15_11005 [Pontivivens ytuae]